MLDGRSSHLSSRTNERVRRFEKLVRFAMEKGKQKESKYDTPRHSLKGNQNE